MLKSSDYERSDSKVQRLQRLGLLNTRNLFWSFYEPRNFGDWIGPYLFEAIAKRPPYHCHPKTDGFAHSVYSAGSIMRHIKLPNRAIVWGSGIISEVDIFERPRRVLAVRGPRTSQHLRTLGYTTTETYGDPGILLPLVYSPKPNKTARVGLIPHFVDFESIRAEFAGRDEVKVIDVRLDVEAVVNEILSCEVTLSSSLHGLVVSHSYDIPCAWIGSATALHGDGVKFLDYFEAGGITGNCPIDIQTDISAKHLEAIARSAEMPNLEALREELLECCPFGKWNLVD